MLPVVLTVWAASASAEANAASRGREDVQPTGDSPSARPPNSTSTIPGQAGLDKVRTQLSEREASLTLASEQLTQVRAAYEQLKKAGRLKGSALAQASAARSKLEGEIGALRREWLSTRYELETTRQELAGLKEANAKLAAKFAAAKETLATVQGQLAALSQEHSQHTRRLLSLSDQVIALQREKDTLTAALRRTDVTTGQQRAGLQVEIGTLQERLEERARQLAEASATHTRLASERDHYQQLIAERDAQLDGLKETVAAREQSLAALQTDQAQLGAKVTQLEAQRDESRRRERQLAAELERVQLQMAAEIQRTRFAISQAEFERAARDRANASESLSRMREELRLPQGERATPKERLATDTSAFHAPAPPAARSGLRVNPWTLSPPGSSSLKVQHVSEELGLVVLDVKGIEWTKEGAQLLLDTGTPSPLRVTIAEVNSAGLALAHIQGNPPRPLPIKRGDTVLARPQLTP